MTAGQQDARPVLLIISQIYVPDPASVGQHLADAAAELVRRGIRVKVLTSANGYEDPSRVYPDREVIDGVEVERLHFSSFGKASIGSRLAGQGIFVAQALARALVVPGLAGVLVSTSPPFCGAAGALLSRLRGVPMTWWLMDLNPDQIVAMGLMRPDALPVRVFDALNRFTLASARKVVVLDRFMRDRVTARWPVSGDLDVMPPWPHEDHVQDIDHAANAFRSEHVPLGKFVVMYSGNHSPANPLTTLLDAAERLRDDPRFLFLFVGGGSGKAEVERRIEKGAVNLRSLPYQPLEMLRWSLSSADVHVVSVGDEVVGIVHPCKAYGAMAVSRPLLVFAPRPSHLADLVDRYDIGRQIQHGDVAGAVQALRELADMPATERAAMGRRAGDAVAGDLSRETLRARFCDVVESSLRRQA